MDRIENKRMRGNSFLTYTDSFPEEIIVGTEC